jgi:THO complex subunit 2
MRWHSDKEIYDKECAYTPGFVTKFRGSNEFSEPNDNVHYENYRHVCHKWHYKITKSLINLLESKEYIQIRNAIIILIRILPHFPVISRLAQFIEKRIVKVMEEEKKTRQDLCILATSYCGQLMARIPHMMKESEFHVMVPSSQANAQDSTSVVVKEEKNGEAGSTPHPDPLASKATNSEVAKGKKTSEEEEGEKSKRNHKEEKLKKETLAFSDDERILEEYTEEYLPLSKDDSSKHSAKKTSSVEAKETKRRKPEKRPTDSEGEKKVKKVRKARTSVGGGGEEEKERKERKVTKKRVRAEVGQETPKRRTKESKSKVVPDDEIPATDKKRRYSKEKSPTRISRDKKYSAERKVWR